MTEQSSLDRYFGGFHARLIRLARQRGVDIEPQAMDSQLVAEVLELAGAVAHAGERRYAPLASFAAGVAVGRLRAAGALGTDQEVTAFVAELKKDLDAAG
jgi:hypothetical protein